VIVAPYTLAAVTAADVVVKPLAAVASVPPAV
jgi:hypothetical protein